MIVKFSFLLLQRLQAPLQHACNTLSRLFVAEVNATYFLNQAIAIADLEGEMGKQWVSSGMQFFRGNVHINDQRQPEPQFCYVRCPFHRIYAVEALAYDTLFPFVGAFPVCPTVISCRSFLQIGKYL